MLKEANEMKALYDSKMENIDKECAMILENATQKAKSMEAEIITVARSEADKLKASALNEIETEKRRVQNDMKTQIIDVSTLLVQKYVGANMKVNIQSKLLDEAISDLGDATWLN